MKHRILLSFLMLLFFSSVMAEESRKDTAFANLYRHYFELYADSDEQAFYEASAKMKEYYLKYNKIDSYYKIYLNEILYDTEQGKTYRAIKKANAMLKEMEEKNDKHYDIVYSALGNIYDTRGNYRMANKYYQDALKACAPKDTGSLISIYSRIASLQAHREPQKAWEVNELFGKMAVNKPEYYKVYTVQKAELAFYMNDRKRFEEAYEQYLQVSKEHPLMDAFGRDMIGMAKATFDGDYDTALKILSKESTDFEPLDRCDMRIKVYELMGNRQLALRETDFRRDLRDSLNSDMLFESINEINTEMGMQKIEEQSRIDRNRADKKQKLLLSAIILLLVAALGLVVSRSLVRHRYQKRLLKKNQELEIALSRAEESDRMKTSFIEHVSHEIRTPLNVITGFAQIITNPTFHLKEEQRNKMINDISNNTIQITNMVNDLLELAQDESKVHYQQNDDVNINQLCEDVMKRMALVNNGKLQLQYKNLMDENFVMRSNRKALEKILSQLMKNAINFTKEGSVELRVRERAANGGIEFAVTDTGLGIAEKDYKKIFERFYKVDSFKPGMGLGLPMSRKIAERLGGTLDIDSSYKQGARFLLVMPVQSS
jgi:signal transduction histidine kinase